MIHVDYCHKKVKTPISSNQLIRLISNAKKPCYWIESHYDCYVALSKVPEPGSDNVRGRNRQIGFKCGTCDDSACVRVALRRPMRGRGKEMTYKSTRSPRNRHLICGKQSAGSSCREPAFTTTPAEKGDKSDDTVTVPTGMDYIRSILGLREW